MTYKIAVCDDSDADRAHIAALTSRWAEDAGHTALISEFSSAESFFMRYDGQQEFDILLLDIEMGGMDGVEMAKRLRIQCDTVEIIFITGYSDYIAEGYEVSALHYLLKPVHEDKLRSVLCRAAEKIRKNERVLTLETGGETVRLPIYKIRYAEVFGNYVTIHADAPVTVKMTLGELMRELDDRFYRVSRSAVVNITEIGRVTKSEIRLSDGSSVPLPRGAYEGVNRAIINMK